MKSSNNKTHVAGHTFILFHQALVVLIDLEHLADTIARSFGLITTKQEKPINCGIKATTMSSQRLSIHSVTPSATVWL